MLEACLFETGDKTVMSTLNIAMQYCPEVLARAATQEKRKRRIGEEETKIKLFTNDMML